MATLTDRERQEVTLLSRGMAPKQIARELGTRPATVMNRLAKGYTDQEIDALADYFSKRK